MGADGRGLSQSGREDKGLRQRQRDRETHRDRERQADSGTAVDTGAVGVAQGWGQEGAGAWLLLRAEPPLYP